MVHLFLFHRDLRLQDNTTIIHQLKTVKKSVIPIFIFTPEQIDKKKNKYFSNNSVQFMIESLLELSNEIGKHGGKLYFFRGDTNTILAKIHQKTKIESIGYNLDYTPYARQRDENIEKWASSKNITIFAKEDYALYNILEGHTLKKDGKPYLVYTPFMKFVSSSLTVPPVDNFSSFRFEKNAACESLCVSFKILDSFYVTNTNINVQGGRSHTMKILNNLKQFQNYSKCRNMLTYQTTKLSASLHYTTCSIREAYHKIVQILGKNSGLIRELIFRDFYMNVVYYFPRVLEGQIKGKNKSFQEKYDKIKWSNNKSAFKKWCEGMTGFPVVDAAMRQMNETGYMHNRCRMIVSSFLTKDLHIDWRLGEQYFATRLEDYDAINNSSGWQWSTGNGTDAQPWFRIFNPWTQQKDYDPDCVYIKRWIPELKNVSVKDIHQWYSENVSANVNYPKPIIIHDDERKATIQLYKKYL